jgi:hypothetical protein
MTALLSFLIDCRFIKTFHVSFLIEGNQFTANYVKIAYEGKQDARRPTVKPDEDTNIEDMSFNQNLSRVPKLPESLLNLFFIVEYLHEPKCITGVEVALSFEAL